VPRKGSGAQSRLPNLRFGNPGSDWRQFIKIVASFPPDGCDDTGGKAFPQMRLSALFFWPLYFFGHSFILR
jgi:hypothetical protein